MSVARPFLVGAQKALLQEKKEKTDGSSIHGTDRTDRLEK